ncbi:BCCT family transporter [Curvivirga aplysinae]|uniref:BCCT family transporter n=1 Tax=Curvivirga aplysinae TaxID=2529852 RepID=UPI001C3F65BC|nr:BCCT family transporter [Curvivirga aplysinae]
MSKNLYETDYEVGQDNLEKWGMDFHHPVFWIASVVALMFIVGVLLAPEASKGVFDGAKWWSIGQFDWLFMIGGNIFVIFSLVLIVLPFGKIRLGGASATPEFSKISWFAMLFAAGMGIGLMFWSVAEPVAYYTGWYKTPLGVEANTAEAATMAMSATMFHWGLHPWAIYAVVGLTLAFFTFNKGLPLTIRSAFYPLIGNHSWGIFGHVVDVIAVLATLFGLATSLGFGASQAAGGLEFLFGIENSITSQIAIIVVVTAIALFSVLRGLDKGVKILSNVNMGLAGLLAVFVLFAGPTAIIFMTLGDTLLAYIMNVVPMSNWMGREDEAWMQGWTVFYWAWWISWSPFVGMFIARISKGRTVREFVIAVLLIPTLVTLVWMSIFGGSALDQVQNGVGQLAGGLGKVELAMFQMLENLPMAELTSALAVLLVLVFFITSSDSGSLVIDAITAGGKVDSPAIQRVFWVMMVSVVAAVLLFGGGADALTALQAAAITVGLPFTVILLVMCVCLFMGLRHEYKYGSKK